MARQHATGALRTHHRTCTSLTNTLCCVFRNMYGTSLRAVAAVSASGKVPILDIDIQGAEKVGVMAMTRGGSQRYA